MDESTVIEVRGLTKSYGGTPVLRGLDLTVRAGTIFALLGPNGAGKTTAVEILQGLRRADGGTIRVLGEDPERSLREWRARIGVVSQSSADLGDLTVREAVAGAASFFEDPMPIEDALDHVDLGGEASRRVGKLSGGQRRRLDIAMAIVGRPELLFLDEPTTGLDPEVRRRLWSMIRGLSDGGTAIVLTTHYLDEVVQLADEAAIILGGRIAQHGAIDELTHPRDGKTTVAWLEDGRRREEESSTPTAVVRRLLARLAPDGGEVPELTLTTPTLEERYLALVAAHEAGESIEPAAPSSGPSPLAGGTTAQRSAPSSSRRSRGSRPGRDWSAIGWLTRSSLVSFVREPVGFVMQFLYPAFILVIFNAVFPGKVFEDMTYATYLLPAMVTTGILTTCLQNLAVCVAGERETGFLKRLAVLPGPATAHVLGKILSNLVLASTNVVLLLCLGHFAFDIDLPSGAGSWGLLLLTIVLMTATSTALGMAIGRVRPSARAASALVTPIVLVVQFTSGIFFPLAQLPDWMVDTFSILPVRWSAELMRQAMLPDSFQVMEPTGSWETAKGLAIVVAWLIGGIVVAVVVARRDRVDR